jgi:hypothetical protein
VPPPRRLDLAALPSPVCWGCPRNSQHPLAFQIDLDVLAPLGDGEGNTAVWLEDFAKPDGARRTWHERLIFATDDGAVSGVFAPDDPMLLEAEPWMDQATCIFYPEVWAFAGEATPMPDLEHVRALARSWLRRGRAEPDAERAREDFRRVVRAGRLLLQDDFTVLQNLVGLTLVRQGAEALYERARNEGDAEAMLAASYVVSEANGIYMASKQRMTPVFDVYQSAAREAEATIALTGFQARTLIQMARHDPQRALRWESMLVLWILAHRGEEMHRVAAAETLRDLTGDADPAVGEIARWLLDRPFTEEFAKGLAG